jgi:RNA polymerase sigma-70 factor, ECF subfamily
MPVTDVELDALVAAACAGDRDAFGGLWQRLSPSVLAYFRAHAVGEAEDLTSEVFLAVFRSLGSFEGDAGGFRGLLFSVAHRRYVDWVRRQRVRRGTVPLELATGLPAQRSAEDLALDRLGLGPVRQLLAVLTEDQAQVVTLRILGDLSIAQTAQVLGRDAGAVKALQHRALARLRKELSGDPYPRAALGRWNPRHA